MSISAKTAFASVSCCSTSPVALRGASSAMIADRKFPAQGNSRHRKFRWRKLSLELRMRCDAGYGPASRIDSNGATHTWSNPYRMGRMHRP